MDYITRPIKEDPVILGIESSCDETAAAVIRGRTLLSDEIISSAGTQAEYGGVVPEIASRVHAIAIDEVVDRAVKAAGITLADIDGIAVTYGAGLLGSLLVGLSFAKSLAYSLGVPLLGVNHIRGHLSAAYLVDRTLKPPFISLLASGGHTAVLYTGSETSFSLVASTLDDAAGEAFDKCARVLSLPYPGGPNIERLAREGSACIPFPKVAKKGEDRFSYSGLKTAVINYCHNKAQKGEEIDCANVAASFQAAAIDPLIEKTVEAARRFGVKTVTAGGGVVANGYLREKLTEACGRNGLTVVLPEKRYCTDNAAMIASEGLIQYRAGHFSSLSLNARAAIPLKGDEV